MFYLTFFLGVVSSIFNNKKKMFFLMFGILLMILAFFRYGIGADYFNYLYLYERISPSLKTELFNGLDNQELGFRGLGTVFKALNVPYQVYISIIAIIHLVFIMKICKKYSLNSTASLLIFFCFYYFTWTFSGLRQGLTIAIGIYYLLKCIEQKKGIKLIIISVLLSLIHLSALMLIPLYYVSRIEWKKSHLIVLSVFSFLFSFVSTQVVAGIVSYFPFSHRIMPYVESNTSIMNNLDFSSLGRICFLLVAFIFYDSVSNHSPLMKKILNVFIISLNVYFLFKFSELAAARLSIYGKLLDIIILPSVYYLLNNKKSKIIYLIFLFMLATALFLKEMDTMVNQAMLIQNNDTFLVPYPNIFNKEDFAFDQLLYDLLKK